MLISDDHCCLNDQPLGKEEWTREEYTMLPLWNGDIRCLLLIGIDQIFQWNYVYLYLYNSRKVETPY